MGQSLQRVNRYGNGARAPCFSFLFLFHLILLVLRYPPASLSVLSVSSSLNLTCLSLPKGLCLYTLVLFSSYSMCPLFLTVLLPLQHGVSHFGRCATASPLPCFFLNTVYPALACVYPSRSRSPSFLPDFRFASVVIILAIWRALCWKMKMYLKQQNQARMALVTSLWEILHDVRHINFVKGLI